MNEFNKLIDCDNPECEKLTYMGRLYKTPEGKFCSVDCEKDFVFEKETEDIDSEKEKSRWKQWLFIALALVFLAMFFSSSQSSDESTSGEDVLIIGQTRLLTGNVRACWDEQFTISAMEYIEKMPFPIWSFRFDQFVTMKACGMGNVIVTLVERFDTIYTDSDGDEWRIIKATRVDFPIEGEETFIFLLLLNKVLIQDEYENYLLRQSV